MSQKVTDIFFKKMKHQKPYYRVIKNSNNNNNDICWKYKNIFE